jgi:4-diphosphocytidyl-2-C-methyl-D-erythritol kinase
LNMTRRVGLRSLAKINLDLRVLHKRADGFHELRTVFQTMSLADRLAIEFEPARKTQLSVDGPEIPDNLVIRAARAVLDEIRVSARVMFKLDKRIPMGAGLGGGSSNAAAVLLALPVLARRRVPFETLCRLGSALGSDVPFFLSGGTALGLGRGTELYPLPDTLEEEILLVSRDIHVATGPAYQALERLTLSDSSSSIISFQAFVRTLVETRSARVASALSENDFEAVVFKQYPKLKTMYARLRKLGAAGVRMTGSGSSIFAIFASKEDRERARAVLEVDRGFLGSRMISARLVSGRRYRSLWRRQLREHLIPDDRLWPPRSRYER